MRRGLERGRRTMSCARHRRRRSNHRRRRRCRRLHPSWDRGLVRRPGRGRRCAVVVHMFTCVHMFTTTTAAAACTFPETVVSCADPDAAGAAPSSSSAFSSRAHVSLSLSFSLFLSLFPSLFPSLSLCCVRRRRIGCRALAAAAAAIRAAAAADLSYVRTYVDGGWRRRCFLQRRWRRR